MNFKGAKMKRREFLQASLAAAVAKAVRAQRHGAVEVLPYGVGPCWPAEMGDVRVRVRVSDKADAVWAHIPWRRRDLAPEEKDILLVDAQTGQQLRNVARIEITREFAEVVFQPQTVPGKYYLYYLPCKINPTESEYKVQYYPPRPTADSAWLRLHDLLPDRLAGGRWKTLPAAQVLEIQARSEFDRFDPMEVIATREEREQLLARFPSQDFLLFSEERQFPIRMTEDLPLRWILSGPRNEFHGEAKRGEFYVFQVGVFACRNAAARLSIDCGDLKSGQGAVIPASALRCFNLGVTDWLGRPFRKEFTVPRGKTGALWFGVQVPKDAAAGNYRGTLVIRTEGGRETQLELSLGVSPHYLEDAGDSELWRHSRLRWLDSTIALDEELTAPFTPMTVNGRTLTCLGRQVSFGDTGLPESIRSNDREILAEPINLVVETTKGKIQWTGGNAAVVRSTASAVTWEAQNESHGFSLHCQATMEFDGYIEVRLHLRSDQPARVEDLRLEIPFLKDVATYMMGLGRKGGYRPPEWKWTWDIDRANNSVWMGDYNAGLQLNLKGTEDTWDMEDLKASGIPSSWGNDGKGGCTVSEEGRQVVVRAYSGERSLRADEELQFHLALLATPVKPLDQAHWTQRYYHIYGPPEDAVRCGATIINVHQGNELNPYINYPFLTVDKLSAYVDAAHRLGLKVKIYYTVRELTNHVVEFWALRSLGGEIFTDGPGGGGAWLREHVVSHYAPGWHETLPTGEVDAAIATTGLSRWHNYYLEGLAWLLRKVEIDGLYLDGIGYDRQIMKRVRKVLDRNRPGSLLDFHEGNDFPFHDLRISPANKYMEHFPYINSLWFGELFDYNESPDYWLVEMSGIPFGLFGEMLQDNGNPWRGMVYGMTARYYSGADPKHIWKLWDEFGIQDAEMIGYWVPACPVKATREGIQATVYRKKGKALISIASWAKEPVACRLEIDWSALGMDAHKARLSAQNIPDFQKEAEFEPSAEIPIEPRRGWLLLLEEKTG
jgi:hypothetical protein